MSLNLKSHLKKVIPSSLLALRRRYLSHPRTIFTTIYERGYWGMDDRQEKYYSGPGSHDPVAVEPYVSAVGKLLSSLSEKPDAVDLGCGDFNVGSQIRRYCRRFIACDIVKGLIARNKAKYKAANVEFRVLNIISDELPDGDVVFIRQVFQHLANSDIKKVLAKAVRKYRLMIVSEHLPLQEFVPNFDKPTDFDIRISTTGSGVVLTEPPFDLKTKRSEVLCEVAYDKSVVRTVMYDLDCSLKFTLEQMGAG